MILIFTIRVLFEVERYQPRNRMSRDTTSGESDSNASDVNSSVVNGGNAVNMQSVPKRYFNPLSETNRLLEIFKIFVLDILYVGYIGC